MHRTLLLTSLLLTTLCFAEAPKLPENLATHAVPRDAGWMKRHEGFNSIAKEGKAPLVFLGDSITQGWGGKGKAAWDTNWAPLGAVNFGIGGDRTEHVLWRIQNGNFEGIKPRLIVLMIGTNNTGHVGRPQKELGEAVYHGSAEHTSSGVKAILDLLGTKLPETKVLLLGIFPRGEKPTDKMREQNAATNRLISKYADDQRIFYKDIGQTFLTADGILSKDIMPDLLHLNEKGYEMWTQAIAADVKKLLDK